MDNKKVMSIIKRQEGLKLDFKLKLSLELESGKKELAKDICAIANSKGGRGYIVVGIEDKTKKIIGLNCNELLTEEQIQQIVSSRCEPPIPISVDIYTVKQKQICIITIYDGCQKPYQLKDNGAFYIRRGSTTDTMRKQELVEAFEENLDFFIETCPIVRSNIELLNKELIKKYFKNKGIYMNENNEKFLMESAGITYVDKESREVKCTLGGLLVFAEKNSICVPQNMIRITNKINKDNCKIEIVQGNLLSMIDKSEEILRDILPKNYPIAAIIEGINNGVLYREYSTINRCIEVIISERSVIINSPGQRIQNNTRGRKSIYNKRNMWLYEKLITLDDNKRFINNEGGFARISKAFNGRVKFINCKEEKCFKVILPGTRFY
ncbi:RNA-binding domain-containing protein [Clostridium sp.]|uniref:AlbA family DNA-binding domain-containing protein n=1 Tax=Clostridium sp. TaxID=1506 RepID=UPI0032163336